MRSVPITFRSKDGKDKNDVEPSFMSFQSFSSFFEVPIVRPHPAATASDLSRTERCKDIKALAS